MQEAFGGCSDALWDATFLKDLSPSLQPRIAGQLYLLRCVQLLRGVQLFATPWTVASRLLCPWDFPGKNTIAGCHFLLHGIFLTQGLNQYLLSFLHLQVDSLPLHHLESPYHPRWLIILSSAKEYIPWRPRSCLPHLYSVLSVQHGLEACLTFKLCPTEGLRVRVRLSGFEPRLWHWPMWPTASYLSFLCLVFPSVKWLYKWYYFIGLLWRWRWNNSATLL